MVFHCQTKFFKKLLIVTGLTTGLFFPRLALAQQEPQFTQYMFNYVSFNPAYAGLNDAINVSAGFRDQWHGFKDMEGNKISPESIILTADMPIRLIRGGVSLSMMRDKLGPMEDIYARLGYSYHMPWGSGKLGIGANVGFINKKINFGSLQPIDDDPLLKGGTDGIIFTDLAAGVFYYNPGGLQWGLSATQLMETARNIGSDEATTFFKLKRHYYATVGYNFAWLRYPSLEILPSLLVKSDLAAFQIDLNTIVKYNQLWGGITYRLHDAIAVMAGLQYKEINVGYSYDIPTLRVGFGGSHEITARYSFKLLFDRDRKSGRNTRHL